MDATNSRMCKDEHDEINVDWFDYTALSSAKRNKCCQVTSVVLFNSAANRWREFWPVYSIGFH